ncbi:MAG: PorT family protein [Crocinitomicaceae bacterium]|nr:PorT family protein [Crocinitomicaceae bacterium]MBK6952220.1 PorT family protein [Crocinitomicaceae bacterium]MBK9593004.1 PorT family protein [Crocinitomicaceae bacterium]
MKKTTLIIILTLNVLGHHAIAQNGKNYPEFDRKHFHFGFALGVNTADFHYTLRADSLIQDSLTGITIKKQPGFNLGIISSWNIHETLSMRFVPSLSFQERLFQYSYVNKGVQKVKENRLESTTLDFPIMLKLRTKRLTNFAAYAITGFQYSLDLASQKDVDQTQGEPIVKIKQHDFSYQVGGGFDFWMPYFKFAIELKLSNGIKNVVIQDNTFFMDPLSSLKTKVWWFSITFEG